MWRTIGNVLIAAMNKGLFIPACIFFLVLVMLLRTPEAYVPALWKGLGERWGWGYILAVAAVTGWGMNVRYLRRIHHTEMKRVTDEKRQLQQERVGEQELPSSDKHS